MRYEFRRMKPSDWPHVARIYGDGLLTRTATFETEVPSREQWDGSHLATCRWVAVTAEGGATAAVLGWAALSPVSTRAVYAGVAEVSIYVAKEAWGEGLGSALLQRLVEDSEAHGLWTLTAGIMKENEASIRMHRTCGFRVLGTRERIGKLDGVWRDTVLMERRSSTVGLE